MISSKSSVLILGLMLAACNPAYFPTASTDAKSDKKIHYKKFTRLDLSNQQLSELPENIANYSNLLSINLSRNPDLNLEQVFDQLAKLPELQIVLLDSNHIENLPTNISSIKLLAHLSLVGNPDLSLQGLVESLQYSPNLTSLNLSNNNIEKLPQSFSSLSSITNLRLSNNVINSAEDFAILGDMEQLTLLWLDDNNIDKLPVTISHLRVSELYLDNNEITELPPEMASCHRLRVLYIGNNKLTELPKLVMKLPRLYFLVLNKNQISTISQEFGQSDYTLSALVLDDNQLSAGQIILAKKYFSGFFLLSM